MRLLSPDGKWRDGFLAVSGPLSDEAYGVIVWVVAEEEEWETATLNRRPPVRMPWPLDHLKPEEG